MTKALAAVGLALAAALFAAGCAAGKAFSKGDEAMRAGDLDQAVVYYRTAVQADPDNPNYKISLQRAMQGAARMHLEKAKQFEDQDQLEAALSEYKSAAELDPSNRVAAMKVSALDRTIRDRVEAARPKPPIQQMRERARATEPVLNPASREPLNIRFNNANFKDILTFISNATGINVAYDRDVVDRPTTVQLDGVTVEQALTQILSTNQLSYKVLNDRSILVFQDTLQKHLQYDEQVIKTIYLSNADPTDISQIISGVIRIQGLAVQPAIVVNKSSNSITVRATANIVQILEKVIEQNDKPRAEIVVDVEILEVDSTRAKQYGLNLSDYAVGAIFSPEVAPNFATTSPAGGVGGTTPGGNSVPPGAVRPPPIFNMNTISRGISTADFYLAVPAAIVRFLETDSHTKLMAKPQLRGAEGSKLSLKLGYSFPVISTSYTPIATGGAGQNPLNSYNYKDLGVNLEMTPRVTLEGDVLLDLNVEDTSFAGNVAIAGQDYPQFNQRTVATHLRLRDGESNLLAGLLQQQDTNTVQGFPGAIHVPFLKEVFSGNTTQSQQTDIVILLTPHIIRTHEVTEADLQPLYIGAQGVTGAGLGVGGGPPPLIAPAETPAAPAPTPPPGVAPGTSATPGAVPGGPTSTSLTGVPVAAPPGTSPVPGTVVVPVQPAPTPAPAAQPPPVAPPAVEPQAPAAPPPGAGPTVAPPPAPRPPAAAQEPPVTSPGFGQAQVTLGTPGTTFRLGGGPYTVPISIAGVARLSTITLTLTYDPAVVRVRNVQEGSFMRSGGVAVSFNQQSAPGRLDVTIARGADATGATGGGLLTVVQFDAVAAGRTTLTLSGAATGSGGTAMGLQFRPVAITVQ